MSKFKVGDVVRTAGYENRWKVAGFFVDAKDPSRDLLLKVIKHKGNPDYEGKYAFGDSSRYELAPTTHKTTVITYRREVDGSVGSMTYPSEYTFKRHYPTFIVLKVTELEVEIPA